MNISSSNYDVNSLYQTQSTQKKQSPSATELASKIMKLDDLNGDSSLSADEMGLSSDAFSKLDTNKDGSVSADELQTSIGGMLDSIKNQKISPEQLGDFLSALGLQVPSKPEHKDGMPNVGNIANKIFDKKDTNGDGNLTIEEMGVSKELFSSLDSDADGKVSKDELQKKLTSMFDDVKSGKMEKSDFATTMAALGAEPPKGGGSGGSATTKTYEAADTNQDGTVSLSEYEAYYGTAATSSGTTTASSNNTNSSSGNDMATYVMKLVTTLVDSLKKEQEANGTDDKTNLSQFKQIMSMVNEQTQDAKTKEMLGEYLKYLTSSVTTSSTQSA